MPIFLICANLSIYVYIKFLQSDSFIGKICAAITCFSITPQGFFILNLCLILD
jgi:hypothetical protein